MRISIVGSSPFDIPTGVKISESDWDLQNQCAQPSCQNAASINITINQYRATVEEVFARYEFIEKRAPSPQEVKDLFNDLLGLASDSPTMARNYLPDLSFFHSMDEFISKSSEQNQWANSTIKKFHALKQHLLDFDEQLCFAALSESRLTEFVKFLQKKDLVNTSVAKYISFLRWFLRWAATQGIYDGNLHETFKPRLKGTSVESKEIIYCTQEEVRKLQNCKFTSMQESLEHVRDMFLFCCFTGLRYSDVAKLKKTDIRNGIIHIVTRKTDEALQIELNKHSKAILDKYKHVKTKGNTAIPILSNVKSNLYLKTIGQLAGLNDPTRIVHYKGSVRHDEVLPKWALLTTHCARRTFVITALQLGIPAEVIMKWTGHSDYDSMKPYIKIVDELKVNSMSRFDSL